VQHWASRFPETASRLSMFDEEWFRCKKRQGEAVIEMEDSRCRIVALETDELRCRSPLNGVAIEMEDLRCKSLSNRVVLEIEDPRCGAIVIQTEDPRCNNLHLNW
jgi:hypothetical protein